MSKVYDIVPNKTYATRANAVNAAVQRFPVTVFPELRFFIALTEPTQPDEKTRYFPVFIGRDAVEAQVFRYFNVIA